MNRSRPFILAALVAVACSQPATTRIEPTPTASGPFAAKSTLPFQAPDFDRITTPIFSRPSRRGCGDSSPRSTAIANAVGGADVRQYDRRARASGRAARARRQGVLRP